MPGILKPDNQTHGVYTVALIINLPITIKNSLWYCLRKIKILGEWVPQGASASKQNKDVRYVNVHVSRRRMLQIISSKILWGVSSEESSLLSYGKILTVIISFLFYDFTMWMETWKSQRIGDDGRMMISDLIGQTDQI